MKTIGLIGGISWESSIKYYEIINTATRNALGGLHSAKSVMYSVDFDETMKLVHEDRWDESAKILIDIAKRLEKAGADFIVICTGLPRSQWSLAMTVCNFSYVIPSVTRNPADSSPSCMIDCYS